MSSKAQVARLLYGGPGDPGWAILSSDQVDQEDQEANRRMLRNILASRGYEYLEVDGLWQGQSEAAVLIVGISVNEAGKLARYFHQDAYISKHGLYHMTAGGWYARRDIRTKVLLLDDNNDGSLYVLLDRSVIHCSDGRLTLICEI